MEQNEISDLIGQVPNRDWLLYKKVLDTDLADIDFLSVLIILADQRYKAETGKHDLNRFLDMNLIALKDHLDITSDDDEPEPSE